MNNKTSNNTERLKQLAKELRESNEIKRFYGNNFTEGSKYCIISETELIPIAEAIEEVLAEREQKDKRIKELEEDLTDSIPNQAVIDKINEYDKRMEEDAGHLNWVITDRIVMNVLQELLEGRNENG